MRTHNCIPSRRTIRALAFTLMATLGTSHPAGAQLASVEVTDDFYPAACGPASGVAIAGGSAGENTTWVVRLFTCSSVPDAEDLTLLSDGEVRALTRAGGDVHPHELKPRRNTSHYDLYKAKQNGNGYIRGDIFYMRKPAYGTECPVPTGVNIKDYM
jgi:hypothetical protein